MFKRLWRGDNGKEPGGVLAAVFSDLHVGSIRGLCPPHPIPLDDGGTYTPLGAQRQLHEWWGHMWAYIAGVKEETGWPLVIISNGDLIDGDHHGTHQIWTQDDKLMMRVAVELLEPLLDLADWMYILRGTESHVGQNAAAEEHIAYDLHGDNSPVVERPLPDGRSTYSWWHVDVRVAQTVFNVHHHPESHDMRPWTKSSGAIRISKMVQLEYSDTDSPLPQVALRSHRHGFRDSGMSHRVRTFVTPPWQLRTGYVERFAAGRVEPVGGLLFRCYDDDPTHYAVEPLVYMAPRKPPEVLE